MTAEAVKVLETLLESRTLPLELVTFDWGAENYLRAGVTLPEGALEIFRREFHAIFIGAQEAEGRWGKQWALPSVYCPLPTALAGWNAIARNRPITNPPTWAHQATPPPVAD